MSRRAEVAVLVVAVLVSAVATIATQPRDVFWGSDSANRFIQVQSIARTGSIAIQHRFPIGHHFVAVGGRTLSIWSPMFSLISAPLFQMMGTAGLFILPVAGTILLVCLLPFLTRGAILPAGLVIVFGTPIFWYTVVFWEHTLAAGLLLAAFVLADRDRALVAGLVAGASTLLREEGYIAIVAIAAAIGIAQRAPRKVIAFIAGAVVPLLGLWVYNAQVFGTPLGLHAAVYSSIAQSNKLANVFPFLFEFTSVKPANVLLVAPAIALIAISPFRVAPIVRAILFGLTAIGFAALTFLLFRSPAPIRETLYLQGLFPAVPLTVAMFLSIRRLWGFRLITVLVAIVLTTLSVNVADFGVIWGPRYFLWLLPLIILLGFDALSDFNTNGIVVSGAVVLLICSFTIQIRGLELLRGKLRFSEQLLAAVRQDPSRTVLTDVFWIPEELAAAFYEKDFGVVRSDAEMAAAMKTVPGPFLYIAAREFRLLSNAGLAPMMPRVAQRKRVAGIDPMLDVMLLDVR